MDGILLINKETNFTSRDVCNKISKILNVKKVGHSGTLDPFASGVMIVAVGKATKMLPYLFEEPKTYLAELVLGLKTSTGDLKGEIIDKKEVNNLKKDEVIKAIENLKNITSQIPPMTSAKHYQGIKLYKLAHKGIEVNREKINIKIYDSKLIDIYDNSIIFSVSVSKGTYIRTLGEMLAESLSTVGYLKSLVRTKIGPISLNDCILLNKLSESNLKNPLNFINLPKINLNYQQSNDVKNGKPIILDCNEYDKVLLIYDKMPLAVYEKKENNLFECVRGLW